MSLRVTSLRSVSISPELSLIHLVLFALAIVVGCAPRPTLDELEDEASSTGDWLAVEWREEVIKKSLESRDPDCRPE